MHVTLALTSTTTVCVVCSVHGDTTNGRSDVEMPAATSFAELSELPVRVAGHTDCGASLGADPAHFTTLQSYGHVSDLASDVVLRDDGGVRACATAEDRPLVCRAANAVYLSTHRNHLHRQAVATESGLGRQHTRIHDTTHARQQRLRNTSTERLDCVASTHALGSNDVALPLRLQILHQCQMSRAIGVVLDALNHVFARLVALEVDRPDSSPGATTPVPHDNTARVVAATLAMANLCECELGIRLAFPEMVVDRALQMAHTGSSGRVSLKLEGSSPARGSSGGRGCDGGVLRRGAGLERLFLAGDMSAGHGGEEAAVGVADGSYPGLQHGHGVCEDLAISRVGDGGRMRIRRDSADTVPLMRGISTGRSSKCPRPTYRIGQLGLDASGRSHGSTRVAPATRSELYFPSGTQAAAGVRRARAAGDAV